MRRESATRRVRTTTDVPGRPAAASLRRELKRAGAPSATVALDGLRPMLAELAQAPFSEAGWFFELKWDGFRLLAASENGRAELCYRSGTGVSTLFPEVAAAVAALPYDVVIDGEVVVLDRDGQPQFQRLQKRAQLTRTVDVSEAARAHPATYYIFDLLAFDGLDLRGLPLSLRKAALRRLLPAGDVLRYADHVEEDGLALWEHIRARGLEGLVAKKADAPYRPGRSAEWRKIRILQTRDFAVVGFTVPDGGRVGFGALHLAGYDERGWTYVGRVGSGFTHDELQRLHARLQADRRREPPCGGNVPTGPGHVWVVPRFAVEVRYKEWTRDLLLRQPVFLRIRDDKRIEDCGLPAPAVDAPVPASVRVSNADKVFWPEDDLRKSDLVSYYRRIAPFLLPYLEGRAVVLTRYPDGIHGKSFFQRREGDAKMFVCSDEVALVALANQATIPLHIAANRVAQPNPDWCLLDLDPKDAPFADVVEVALHIRDLCRRLGLPAFVKTSGQSGLHVLVPVGGQLTHDESRAFGELLARTVAGECPDKATITRRIGERAGRVYIDYLQNGDDRLMAAPYCVRARPGAPVSTPLRWSEVTRHLDPAQLNIRTVPARLERLGKDPLHDVLALAPDLRRALVRLEARVTTARRTPRGRGSSSR
jgi:bifunctional non-homologous end joining protein LigD